MKVVKKETSGVPLEWVIPEGMISRYANNIIVQHSESEFIISFFETMPPFLLGSPEDVEQTLKSLESVKSVCVSRIIVSPEKMGDLIHALESNWQKYLAKQEEANEMDEDLDPANAETY